MGFEVPGFTSATAMRSASGSLFIIRIAHFTLAFANVRSSALISSGFDLGNVGKSGSCIGLAITPG